MDPAPSVPSIPAASFPLPPQLEGLRRLAYNLYWAWHPRTRRPVRAGSTATAWTRYRNPIPVLSAARSTGRASSTTRRSWPSTTTSCAEFDEYMANGAGPLVPAPATATSSTGPIAYFCAEYGFHESLGIYSGGLGVLAGDHMKTASDMALPFVGVGLLYRKGYFRQTIDADGHQEHAYPDYDLTRLPLSARPGPTRASR